MAKMPAFAGVDSTCARVLLLLLIPGAVLIGLYGRFKGIGTWPLGVDEFYISRSIDRVLSTGIPSFACGGYYTRSLLYQYLVAALRMGGLSPEFAGRFVAGVGSLLVLPSAYLLGKRAEGPLAGWLTVIILCISIWEIEMARFGRMYAPFQAVFACYLVFYLRYTVDGNARALRWMVVLSIVGVLTWEGGTLLGVANLFAVMMLQDKGRFERGDWRRLGGLLLLLVLLYAVSRDLRGDAGSNDPASAAATDAGAERWLWLHSSWHALRAHPGWAIAFLAPLAVAVSSLRFIGSHRNRWMTFAGLALILLAALVHAFTVVLGLLSLMLLSGVVDFSELTAPRARSWVMALLSLFLYWLAYDHWAGNRSLQSLFGFPDVFQHIAWPLGRAVPVETLAFVLCGGFWFVRSIVAPARTSGAIRAMMGVLVLMVLAVAAVPTERIETRYIFFLYPLLIVLAVAAVLELAKRVPLPATPSAALLVAAPLLCFAATEDFQPGQLAQIDSAASTFRLGMRPARADHYYPRNDMRGVAEWLGAHVEAGDIVISGIPNLDQYDHHFDYFYLDEQDNRYDAYVCADGRTERWTNHRVIFKLATLSPAAASGHHLYATVYSDVEERMQLQARSLGWTVTRVYLAQDGKSAVLSIRGGGRASPTG